MQSPSNSPETAKAPSAAPSDRSERSAPPKQTAVATRPSREISPIEAMLSADSFKRQIALALPKHCAPDRMARIALTECRKNPRLFQSTPESFASALLTCSALGLEPGAGLDHCYLIPRRNGKLSQDAGRDVFEVTFQTGYKGEVELVRRSGQLRDISAECVYEGDKFSFRLGSHPDIQHEPNLDRPRNAKLTHVYAVARLVNGGVQQKVMTRTQVEAIREKFAAKGSDAWASSFEAMAMKTVIRQLSKLLPKSAEHQKAVAVEEAPVTLTPIVVDASPTYEPDPDALDAEARDGGGA